MKRTCNIVAALAALMLVSDAAHSVAATYTWDSGGASPTAPVDGSGTWDLLTPWWSNGTIDSVWLNDGTASAVFGTGGTGASDAVTIGTPVSVAGITFNSTSDTYTLTGTGANTILLSGQGVGVMNGITNNSTGVVTINDNLGLDIGNHTFSNSSGGTLALNGTITPNTGGIAWFNSTGAASSGVTTTLTTDSTGLISGLGAAALYGSTANVGFSSLATVSAGQVVPYTYGAGQIIAAPGAIGATTPAAATNLELTATTAGNYTLIGLTGTTYINTVLLTIPNGGATLVVGSGTGTQTLDMGPVTGVGGFYIPNATTKQPLTVGGGANTKLTAGPMTGTATPGQVIFAIDGNDTGNEAELNATLQNNGSGGAVSLVKTGHGSMFINIAETYTGGTYVDQGYLQGNTATSFGAGPVFVAAGATVFPNSANATFANNFFINPGPGPSYATTVGAIKAQGGTYSGTIHLQGSGTVGGIGDRISINTNNAVTNFTGQITGTGTLDFFGNAGTTTFVLNNTTVNPNNWTGGLILGGTGTTTLKLGANNQIPDGSGFGLVNIATGTTKFDLNGHSDTINGITTSGGTATITNTGAAASTLTVGAADANSTFGGTITDNGGAATLAIVKIGLGTFTLTGTNSYTGGTTISNGVLQVGSGNALGSNTAAVTINGGSLDLNNTSLNIGSLSGSGGPVTNSGNGAVTLTLSPAANSTYGSAIGNGTAGGQTSLIFQGTAAQTLSATSTYTGATSVSSGSLVVTGNISSSSGLSLSGGTLLGTGNAGNVNVTSSSATIDPGTATHTLGMLTLTGLTASSGNFQFDLGGTQTDQLVVNGSVNITGGTFNIALLPSQSIAPNTYTLLSSTSPINVSGVTFNTPTGTRQPFTVNVNTNNVQLVAGVGSPANLVWNTSSALSPKDGFTWDVTTNNNWTASGTVSNGSPNQYYQLDNVTFDDTSNNSHTVTLDGTNALNNTLTPSSITVNTTGTYTFQGGASIGGNTGITVMGGGQLILSNGTNTYAGVTAIQNGTLTLVGSSNLPSTSAVVLGDASNHSGVLDLGGNQITVSGLSTVGSGTGNTVGNSNSSSNATLVVSGGSSTFSGNIVDGIRGNTSTNTSLNVTNNASLILTGNNTFTGSTNIDTGSSLQIGNSGATGTLTATNSINNNGSLTFNVNNTITVAASIGGSGNVVQSGAGTTILTGSNSWGGTTTISAGTLQIGNGGGSGSLGSAATLTDNGALAFNLNTPTTVSTVISGNGTVSDIGTGTITLSGNNQYSGNTTIGSGATLQPTTSNGLGSLTSGAVNILAGGTLDLGAGTAANGLNFGTKQFNLAGTITNTAAAIAGNPTGSKPQEQAFENITLTGNAVFDGTSRWDMRNGAPVLDLGGFTLTKNGVNQISLVNVTFKNGTGGFFVNSGVLSVEGTSNTVGSGFFSYAPGQTAGFFNLSGSVTWTLQFQGAGVLGSNGGGLVTLGSPVTMGGNLLIVPLNSGAQSPGTNNPMVLNGNFTDGSSGFSVTLDGNTIETFGGTNSWGGGTIIQRGTFKMASAGALPTNTSLTFGDVGNDSGTLDLGGFNATVSSLSVVGTGPANTIANSSTTADSTLTFAGGTSNFSGTIQDAVNGGTHKTGLKVSSGTLTLSGVNTYTGTTTINTGANLTLANTNAIGATQQVILNGGTLATGGLNQDLTLGATPATLALSSSSIIDFGSGSSILKFADSSAQTWSGTLTINNWSGTPGSGGGTDELFFGSSSSALTSAQLLEISFAGFSGTAQILSNGEVVPASGPLLGDINQDGHVDVSDIKDLMLALANLPAYETEHPSLTGPQITSILDVSQDGLDNNADIQSLINYLLGGHGSQAPVPEPSSIVLLGLAATAFTFLAKRKRKTT